VQEFPARPTVEVRRVSSIEGVRDVFDAGYGDLWQYLSAQGAQAAGPPFAIYHNMDMSALEMTLGFPVAQPLPGDGNVQGGLFPAGRWATTLHTGPYDDLRNAYAALEAWATAQGYTPSGIACEFYLNDPRDVPPEEYQTQVMFQLQ
jgi:effector-binding domain-containing protein